MTKLIRVLVADDQALLRGSFRLLVDSAADLTVVGEASDGAEAVDLAMELRPDVIVMDVRMPTMDGVEATRRICANAPSASTRVLVLTMFDLDEYVYAALRAGASGFLLKDTPPEQLLAAMPSGCRNRTSAPALDYDRLLAGSHPPTARPGLPVVPVSGGHQLAPGYSPRSARRASR